MTDCADRSTFCRAECSCACHEAYTTRLPPCVQGAIIDTLYTVRSGPEENYQYKKVYASVMPDKYGSEAAQELISLYEVCA